MFEVERSTVTGGGDFLPELSGLAVRLVLLALTVRDGGAQAEELLRHLDLLDVGESVVPLSEENYRGRV